jgi:serine/threonine protein kinase
MPELSVLINQKYKIIRQIGQGGFGKTYLAENITKLDSPRCVVKEFIYQGTNNSEEALRLFWSESSRLKEVGEHPRIPSFLDFFEYDCKFFLVQEYIEGQNLEEELRQEGAFSPEAIQQLLSELLPILTYIHECQLIHRDIKPENIVRRRVDGQLFLVDFGAAKAVSGTILAKTGTMIGSAGYVAPEQVYGKTVYASDVYSLGVTCIHLLTNLSPFELIDYGDWGWHWQDYLPEATNVSEEFSLMLGQMIERGLTKRFKTAHEAESQIPKSIQYISHSSKLLNPAKRSIKIRIKKKIAVMLGIFAIALIGHIAIKLNGTYIKEVISHRSTSFSTLVELKKRYEKLDEF